MGKLNELEDKKQYQTENSNRLAALDNLSDSEDIMGEHLKIISNPQRLGLHKLKQHKLWFD
jgi:hypothetical protein